MRDIDIRKNYDWVPKLIAILALGGAALIVLIALGVVGWLIYSAHSEKDTQTPTIVRQPNVPLGAWQQPEPFVVPNDLQSLPELPAPPAPPAASLRLKHLQLKAARSFSGHTGKVYCAAFSPDEHRLLSCGSDKFLRLWNLDDGKELARIESPSGVVRDLCFAPDGKLAASAGEDGVLRLWDLAEKKMLRTLTGHEGALCCAVLTPDGKRLVSGGDDRSLRVWDVESGQQIHEWYGHDSAITTVTISKDGSRALTGSADGGTICWAFETGEQLAYLSAGKPVAFALFSSDGKRAYVGSEQTASFCDLVNNEQWRLKFSEGDKLRAAQVSVTGDIVLFEGKDKRLHCRVLPQILSRSQQTIEEQSNRTGVEAHRGRINCVRLTRDGKRALTTGDDGSIRLWDLVEESAGK